MILSLRHLILVVILPAVIVVVYHPAKTAGNPSDRDHRSDDHGHKDDHGVQDIRVHLHLETTREMTTHCNIQWQVIVVKNNDKKNKKDVVVGGPVVKGKDHNHEEKHAVVVASSLSSPWMYNNNYDDKKEEEDHRSASFEFPLSQGTEYSLLLECNQHHGVVLNTLVPGALLTNVTISWNNWTFLSVENLCFGSERAHAFSFKTDEETSAEFLDELRRLQESDKKEYVDPPERPPSEPRQRPPPPVATPPSPTEKPIVSPPAPNPTPKPATAPNPTPKPTPKPTSQPVSQPVSQPISQPVSQPISQPVSQRPVSQPVSRPPISQPVSQPISQPVNQPITPPITQPVSQPVTQPVNQPITQPVNQPAKQPVTQPVTQPVNLPVTTPVTQPVTQPVAQPVSQRPVSQPVLQPTTSQPAPSSVGLTPTAPPAQPQAPTVVPPTQVGTPAPIGDGGGGGTIAPTTLTAIKPPSFYPGSLGNTSAAPSISVSPSTSPTVEPPCLSASNVPIPFDNKYIALKLRLTDSQSRGSDLSKNDTDAILLRIVNAYNEVATCDQKGALRQIDQALLIRVNDLPFSGSDVEWIVQLTGECDGCIDFAHSIFSASNQTSTTLDVTTASGLDSSNASQETPCFCPGPVISTFQDYFNQNLQSNSTETIMILAVVELENDKSCDPTMVQEDVLSPQQFTTLVTLVVPQDPSDMTEAELQSIYNRFKIVVQSHLSLTYPSCDLSRKRILNVERASNNPTIGRHLRKDPYPMAGTVPRRVQETSADFELVLDVTFTCFGCEGRLFGATNFTPNYDCLCPKDGNQFGVNESGLLLSLNEQAVTRISKDESVSDVIEIEEVPCSSIVNNFSTVVVIEYMLTANGTTPIAEDLAILEELFVAGYNGIARRYCDPYFRRIVSAETIQNYEISDDGWMLNVEMSIIGTCRGNCTNDIPIYDPEAFFTSVGIAFYGSNTSSITRSTRGTGDRNLQDDSGSTCYCNVAASKTLGPSEPEVVQNFRYLVDELALESIQEVAECRLVTFQKGIFLTVPVNVANATQDQLDQIGQTFIDTYNQQSQQEGFCDEYFRKLVSFRVDGNPAIESSFTVRALGEQHLPSRQTLVSTKLFRPQRRIQGEVNPAPSIAPISAPSAVWNNITKAPSYLPLPLSNATTIVFLDITGICQGCSMDIGLFDQVSARRRFLQQTNDELNDQVDSATPTNRGEGCFCPPKSNKLERIEEPVTQALSLLPFVNGTVVIEDEVDIVECSVAVNVFETVTRLDFLVNGEIVAGDEDYIATGFMKTYNQLTEEFCDSLFRHPDEIVSTSYEVSSGPDQSGVSTVRFWLVLKGTCRGCTGSESLFDSSRRRMQEEELCYCQTNAMQRAPTDQEFQDAFSKYLGSRRRLQQQSKFTLLCVGSRCTPIVPTLSPQTMSPTSVILVNPFGAQNFAGCNVPDPSFIGDGFCDRAVDANGLPIYNNAQCGFDGGDCCQATCQSFLFECGSGGYWCSQDQIVQGTTATPTTPPPTVAPVVVVTCADQAGTLLGDGVCDLELNIPFCAYDGGDCCRSTCGVLNGLRCTGPFLTCVDPNASENAPSSNPSVVPSRTPSKAPSQSPSRVPSTVTSRAPFVAPSNAPALVPTNGPNKPPTDAPSNLPSKLPSSIPSSHPSSAPSKRPFKAPSTVPVSVPSTVPFSAPSDAPITAPSNVPFSAPSNVPFNDPSNVPVSVPSNVPVSVPSKRPSNVPSKLPSQTPSLQPSSSPSFAPTTLLNKICKSTSTCNASSFCGDGFCDEALNRAECGWDGGDCCIGSCVSTIFDCSTSALDYTCRDPMYTRLPPSCNVTNPEFVGDGFCDVFGGYNTPNCNYDGGDCCDYECVPSKYQCPFFACARGLPPGCSVPEPSWIGDGYCDYVEPYNTAVCNWDNGDCCPDTCVSKSFICGFDSAYFCINPNSIFYDTFVLPPPLPTGCNVTYQAFLGDGACDSGQYNTAECNWDFGDCCPQTCNATGYEWHHPYVCGSYGYNCIDPGGGPRRPPIPEACIVDRQSWLGDGGCDAEAPYNTAECLWDFGDCCPQTCNSTGWYHKYECGSFGYTCKDPAVPKPPSVPSGCNVSFPSWLGDGWCTGGAYNTAECGWEFGDCCEASCKNATWPHKYECGALSYNCLDPSDPVPKRPPIPSGCNVTYPFGLGDGFCDSSGAYNTAECLWDFGDCCETSCKNATWPHKYACGTVSYTCLDPADPVPKRPPVPSGCNVTYSSLLGDGMCSGSEYNTAQCGWDFGDCCATSCKNATWPHTYACGSASYNCLDPAVPKPPAVPIGCNVSTPKRLGDGKCDDYGSYNTAACFYDFGDCCEQTCKSATWDKTYECGSNGYNCLNSTVRPTVPQLCSVPTPSLLGDGKCDGDMYNTEACGWDMGDCCLETCSLHAWYKDEYCGTTGYNCSDPSVLRRPSVPSACNVTATRLDELGDGYCSGGKYNVAECNWEFGDCCHQTCVNSTWPRPYECGYFGYECLDPTVPKPPLVPGDCVVENKDYLGDGWCNDEGNYNTKECLWDFGDCCFQTCSNATWYQKYKCDSNSYTCKDPTLPLPPPLPSGCNVTSPDRLGDGACDDGGNYNTAACLWDFGDCCSQTCSNATWYQKYKCGSSGYKCKDPTFPSRPQPPSGCNVASPDRLGDGACDNSENYNTADCLWDFGDCCFQTCSNATGFHVYECGSNDYNCKDPTQPLPPQLPSGCNVTSPHRLGDGACDNYGQYNTADCLWDFGDCCFETCKAAIWYHKYECGSYGYACNNPDGGPPSKIEVVGFYSFEYLSGTYRSNSEYLFGQQVYYKSSGSLMLHWCRDGHWTIQFVTSIAKIAANGCTGQGFMSISQGNSSLCNAVWMPYGYVSVMICASNCPKPCPPDSLVNGADAVVVPFTPTVSPSSFPSANPSKSPTVIPLSFLSMAPSQMPSMYPSRFPSRAPSTLPSAIPSKVPSATPSKLPSVAPSKSPVKLPSAFPSAYPSGTPQGQTIP